MDGLIESPESEQCKRIDIHLHDYRRRIGVLLRGLLLD
jgi:hypothetical protein